MSERRQHRAGSPQPRLSSFLAPFVTLILLLCSVVPTRQFEAPDDLGADKLKDDFEPDKVSAAAGEEYDHVVVGSDLGGDAWGKELAPRVGFARGFCPRVLSVLGGS